MNILPLILGLVLMLSVLTVERLEKFKNQSIIQKEYQHFLKENERQVFNWRQKHLFGESQKSFKQLTFRYIYDKKAREKHSNEANQYRILMIELMKNVYKEAAFYKELERKRSNFLEEMLNEIEKASELAFKDSSKRFIRETKDLARLKLEDPELQQAFYHMLKGTIARDKLEAERVELKEKGEELPSRMKEKAYVSLLTYITIDGNARSTPPTIKIARAPREILIAIFEKEEVVENLMSRREELGANKDSGADELFKSEFVGKVRQGIDEKLLNFELSPNSAFYR